MEIKIEVGIGETKSAELVEGTLTVGRDGSLWFFTLVRPAPRPSIRAHAEQAPLTATVAAKGRSGRLRVRHRLPALPVMFRFPEPVAMLPDSEVLMGFTLPLDLSIEDASGSCLWRLPNPALGRAWYGGLDSGEECLAVQTIPLPIAHALDAPGAQGAAGFPVRLRNETKRRIEIPRVTAPTSRLRLYEADSGYLADPTLLSYEPDDDIRISSGDLRAMAPRARLELADPARESQADQLIKKGMHLLRNLTGLEAR